MAHMGIRGSTVEIGKGASYAMGCPSHLALDDRRLNKHQRRVCSLRVLGFGVACLMYFHHPHSTQGDAR